MSVAFEDSASAVASCPSRIHRWARNLQLSTQTAAEDLDRHCDRQRVMQQIVLDSGGTDAGTGIRTPVREQAVAAWRLQLDPLAPLVQHGALVRA